MVIHRPDWERSMTIHAFTEGLDKSIFWVTAPPKDAGNGTLKLGSRMWTYNPKVNRVIKLPPSMMSQSWMGSDFSYNDLSRSDTILEDYEHALRETKTVDGMTVYVIDSPARPTAPVVWGKIVFEIREDYVLLYEGYFDEDGVLVKEMKTLEIGEMGGRVLPLEMRMAKVEEEDEYTLFYYESVQFGVSLPANLFTASALKNPRR
ncbi:MAG: outer membrane lipoprotein-sorting protein [Deltaproteobacteria bacterium]|nr:outer membrane lipoprotein-sorting protein [Deltaproteobacteria bacterium]